MTEGERHSFESITDNLGEIGENGRRLTEYNENLRWLNSEGLGRAIVHTQTTPRQIVTERTHGEDEGDFRTREVQGETNTKLLGYILPLTDTDADQPQHLVCFTDGTMLHIGFKNNPRFSDNDRQDHLNYYRNSFDPSETPLHEKSVIQTKNDFLAGRIFNFSSKVLSENNTNNQEVFAGLFDRAITVAQERYETKKRTQVKTMDIFNAKFSALRQKMQPPEQPPQG